MKDLLVGVFIYALGFGAVLFIERWDGTPATWGLSLARAVLWPLYLFTGIPKGTRYPMD